MRFNTWALGIAGGTLWGGGVFLLTWWLIVFRGMEGTTNILTQLYIGYSVTPLGSVVGFVWGAADGFIGGVIFAWLYNFLADKLTRTGQKDW